MERTDAQIMQAVAAGDKQAFEIIVERYQRVVINFFYRLTSDRQEAEDLAQETFIKLYRAAPRYRPSGKFINYLLRIASNLHLDSLDKKRVRPKMVFFDTPANGDENGHAPHEFVSEEGGPEDHLDSQMRARRVREAIAALPELYRKVFILSEFHGKKYNEIAEILKIPLGTVSSRKSQAFNLLRNHLKDLLEETND